ncbi:hypothetical protein C8J57DRAFT_1249088 [Mycena rebaudengoi]|nr:hypothetical protein C8J57DRAFT_1249088 [Mycena rebaudengoi]
MVASWKGDQRDALSWLPNVTGVIEKKDFKTPQNIFARVVTRTGPPPRSRFRRSVRIETTQDKELTLEELNVRREAMRILKRGRGPRRFIPHRFVTEGQFVISTQSGRASDKQVVYLIDGEVLHQKNRKCLAALESAASSCIEGGAEAGGAVSVPRRPWHRGGGTGRVMDELQTGSSNNGARNTAQPPGEPMSTRKSEKNATRSSHAYPKVA